MQRIDFYIVEGREEIPFPQPRGEDFTQAIEIIYRPKIAINPLFSRIKLANLPKPGYSSLLDNFQASLTLKRISER